jgi:hypothetical protein
VQVTIFGSRNSVDEAEASIEMFRPKVIPGLAAQVGRSYNVAIDETAMTVIYLNRATMKEVIRREDAK